MGCPDKLVSPAIYMAPSKIEVRNIEQFHLKVNA
jgi:hypothetical protein